MIIGVDGCSGGWVCAKGEMQEDRIINVEIVVVSHPKDIWNASITKMCIDMPIGLLQISNKGGREPDILARTILGKKGASRVFSPPIRQVLYAETYQEALEISQKTPPDGIGLSKQSFYLLPKIRQIDEWLQAKPEIQSVVCETHPELSFWAMGNQTAPSKHTQLGIAYRIDLLEQQNIWNPSFLDVLNSNGSNRKKGIKTDDILDALACMWSAGRIVQQKNKKIPSEDLWDTTGLAIGYNF